MTEPDRSRPFLVLLRRCRCRRANQACDRLGSFAPFARLGLRLETRPDRDGRRGLGRRRRGLGQACRRNGAACHASRAAITQPTSHCCGSKHRDIAPAVLSSVVPDLGSLSVVVAAEHGVPSAALGAISLIGGRWRSLRGGEIDARIELDVRLRHSHEGGLVAQCVRRSHRHGGSGGATRSGHSRRDDRPGRGKA